MSCTGLLIIHLLLFIGDMATSGALCLLAIFGHPLLFRLGVGAISQFIAAELFPESVRSVVSIVENSKCC
ncbi:MAG: hypothetical protein GY696_22775 [Gammaproteobacteria bacterium]|nr:hypothetical protein [Gammaproteobacteria bacterium]